MIPKYSENEDLNVGYNSTPQYDISVRSNISYSVKCDLKDETKMSTVGSLPVHSP